MLGWLALKLNYVMPTFFAVFPHFSCWGDAKGKRALNGRNGGDDREANLGTHTNRKTGVGRVIGDWSDMLTDHYTPHFDFFP